jgi:AraC family transcriptional regulator
MMEWSDRMNAAIDYIEENLAGEIDFSQAAERACCSLYHFQRMFFAVIGVTPAEYSRRRRLTLAARELLSGDTRVIDIALKYGYDSPNAFTRAFRNVHGINPRAARTRGVKLTAFPRISFYIALKGGSDMDYNIREKPAFDVIAKAKRTSSKIYGGFVIDPGTWDKFWYECWREYEQTDKYDAVKKLAGKPGPVTGAGYLGISKIEDDMKGYTYAVGVEKSGKTMPRGLEIIHVPAGTWAIFESTGPFPEAIHDLEDRIFRDWFPSTGYEYSPAPELEVYLPGDRNNPEYRCQVWMPIVNKQKK